MLSTVAAIWALLPSRKGCNNVEIVVMGDKYEYRDDTTSCEIFNWLMFFFAE